MFETGIYCIFNVNNYKKYIGQSTDLKERKYRHFYKLEKNDHFNVHLQRAYNKYGSESFYFIVLEYCNKINLDKREQYYIELYNWDSLYNICKNINSGDRNESKNNNKPVAQIDPKTKNILGFYPSANDADRIFGKDGNRTISKVCLNKRKTAYGFEWSYK